MRRPVARRDGNHAEAVGWFRDLGCSVAELPHAGIPGFPDLVVGCLGRNHLVEIKDPRTAYGRAGLSASQQAFNAEWRGECSVAVSSIDEAAALVSNWRRGAR